MSLYHLKRQVCLLYNRENEEKLKHTQTEREREREREQRVVGWQPERA